MERVKSESDKMRERHRAFGIGTPCVFIRFDSSEDKNIENDIYDFIDVMDSSLFIYANNHLEGADKIYDFIIRKGYPVFFMITSTHVAFYRMPK